MELYVQEGLSSCNIILPIYVQRDKSSLTNRIEGSYVVDWFFMGSGLEQAYEAEGWIRIFFIVPMDSLLLLQ